MSDYTTQDAVKFAMDGNVSDFKSVVSDILANKVRDAIDLKKLDVATNFMSAETEEESFEEEEYEIEGETDDDQEVQ